MGLTWEEKINMLSINPDAATRDDIAQMAADLCSHIYEDRQKTKEINMLVKENKSLASHLLELQIELRHLQC